MQRKSSPYSRKGGGNSKEREKQEGRREDVKQDNIQTKMSTIKIHINRFKFFIKTSKLSNLVKKQNPSIGWISKLYI